MSALAIRPAVAGDAGLILTLLRELAEYESLLHLFKVTEDAVRRDFFGAQPLCRCELAFEGEAPVGVMTWFWTYGSFSAARGIHLEDLFVRPAHRGKGTGKALLAHLARRAVESGANAVQWSVLDWNKPSIAFYESLGARPPEGWLTYRLAGEALKTLAGPQ